MEKRRKDRGIGLCFGKINIKPTWVWFDFFGIDLYYSWKESRIK